MTTRNPKTKAQRAQDKVDILTRRLTKATEAKAELEQQAAAMTKVIASVQKHLDYAKASPDLDPTPPPSTTPQEDPGNA